MMNQNQAVDTKSDVLVKHSVLLAVNSKATAGMSPYRLTDARGNDIKQVNDYLDSLAVRGLSERTIRIYGYDLLNFWRWLAGSKINFADITGNLLFEYIRYQRQDASFISAVTINHRLTVVKCLYQFHFDKRIPSNIHSANQPADYSFSWRNKYRRFGWMHSCVRQSSVRVKAPRRITIPLTYNEVSKFFNSLRSYRDIAITGFMLFCGLRSREVINLKSDDIGRTEGQVLIHGKAGKERMVPLPKDLIAALERYVNLEHPKTNSRHLFVVLKGPRRGLPLTSCAIRKIFRYHRKISGVSNANAHRFRHTFGADMTRAGISLPMLMKLMGHTDVRITMRYVNLFARDVKDEFNKAIVNLRTREILNGTKSEP
jgi:site-specific recombinase XerD